MCYDNVGVINKEKVVVCMDEMYITVGVIAIILLGALEIVVYFLPGIIVYKMEHADKWIILLINFLLGWTFIDTDGSKASNVTRNIGNNKYEDLEKLKENGTITEAEFEIEKAKLLRE